MLLENVNYDYVDYLEKRLAAAQSEKKIIRTELQLELATARLLREKNYHAISVDLIAATAGVAHGTFYRYFAAKRDVVAKTIADYFMFVRASRRPVARDASQYEAIHHANLHYVECFRRNVGLMRCHFRLKDEDELIAEVGRSADNAMVERVLARLRREGQLELWDADKLKLTIHCLIGMVDELLLKIYGQTQPSLAGFQARPQLVASTVSDMWFSTIYGSQSIEGIAPGASSPSLRRID
ncbi:TetR/AcrR family transcriptional regulator [Bosea sp. 2KB_26]|uniref:TetR/AcrR family transcriptional regulator n=1 Tax=Bosea sp. 2KB_26 TaxID=3237475 RepID=UPI003F935403